jgi:hypothetical protein
MKKSVFLNTLVHWWQNRPAGSWNVIFEQQSFPVIRSPRTIKLGVKEKSYDPFFFNLRSEKNSE